MEPERTHYHKLSGSSKRNVFSHIPGAPSSQMTGCRVSLGSKGEPSPAPSSWGVGGVLQSLHPHVAFSPACPCPSESHKLCDIVFLFSFISIYFLISCVLSSQTHWLFKGGLCNFHICEFPRFPSAINVQSPCIMIRKSILYDFSFLCIY